jgi:hypothetical protein
MRRLADSIERYGTQSQYSMFIGNIKRSDTFRATITIVTVAAVNAVFTKNKAIRAAAGKNRSPG